MPGTIIRTSGIAIMGVTVDATVDAPMNVTVDVIAAIFPMTRPHRNGPHRSASAAFNTPAGPRRTQHCDPHSNDRRDDQHRHHDGESNNLRRRHVYYFAAPASPLACPWLATAAAPASAASGSR